MHFSNLTSRVAPTTDQATNDPWEVHSLALERAATGEDIIILSIGQESDEVTPTAVVDAAVDSLKRGRHHYSGVAGTDELRRAIAEYHQQLSGQVVSPDECIVYAGAQNTLFALGQVLLETGDEVVLSEPFYTTYQATFSATGAKAVLVPTLAKQSYRLQAEHILQSITERTRVIVLNSPNNPMGECYDRQTWESILAVCRDKGIWLIHDAVYADIVDADSMYMPQKLAGSEQVLITVGSLSKSHRMSGWRLGWAVGPTRLIEHLANLSMCMHYGLPPFIMDAAVVAIRKSSETPRLIESLIHSRRTQLLTQLSALPDTVVQDSGTGMFILLDVSYFKMNANEFAHGLLKNHAVSVLPCDGFGATGQNLVRVGLCVDNERLDKAGRAIVEYCNTQSPN